MPTGVIHFEDSRKATELFRDKHLQHRLVQLGKDAEIEFISYLEDEKLHVMRSVQVVAARAFGWIGQHDIQKLVLITDLDARGGETLDVEYGFRVLHTLATTMSEDQHVRPYVAAVEDMFDHRDVLVALLTLAPHCRIEEALNFVFGRQLTGVRWVTRDKGAQLPESIGQSIAEIGEGGPKIIRANRSEDEAWLAAVLAEWI